MKDKVTFISKLTMPSNAEIDAHKDFKRLMQRRTAAMQRSQRLKVKAFILGTSLSILLAALLWYFYTPERAAPQSSNTKMEKSAPILSAPDEIIITESHGNSAEVEDTIAKTNDSTPAAVRLTDREASKARRPKEPESMLDENRFTEDWESTEFSQGAEQGLSSANQFKEAYPLMGMDSLHQYLNANLQYPENIDPSQKIEGTCQVLFSISSTGEPEVIEIKNSLGEAFDQQCKVLIRKMPTWQPAVQNGRPVASRLMISLTFRVEKKS